MNSRRYSWIVIQSICLVLISQSVGADVLKSEKSKSDYKWFVSIYGGPRANQSLIDIVTLDATYSDGNYVAVGALAREIYRYEQWLSFELEGLVGKHFGSDNDHWEFAGLVLGRWHPFP